MRVSTWSHARPMKDSSHGFAGRAGSGVRLALLIGLSAALGALIHDLDPMRITLIAGVYVTALIVKEMQ